MLNIMNNEKITNLCRPFGDNGHVFCLRCCLARPNCPLLDRGHENYLGGCLGHHGQYFEALTQTGACQSFQCWNYEALAALSEENMASLTEELANLPPGEYNPYEILFKYYLRACDHQN